VIAGCRPEYMPVLIAIAEILADPSFSPRNAGGTPGWEPIVIVSGPLVRALDFNSGQGVLRVGRQANSTIGRFTRLLMRNTAGLRIPPGEMDGITDKACIGLNFNVALAEDDDAVRDLGWQPHRFDRGFATLDDTVVTVQGMAGISHPILTAGDSAEEHLSQLAKYMTASIGPWMHCGVMFQQWHPLVVMSPNVAAALSRHGCGKAAIRRYLYDHAWIEAGDVERFAYDAGVTDFSFEGYVRRGEISDAYFQSNDPHAWCEFA
jgi:hypothetical protein